MPQITRLILKNVLATNEVIIFFCFSFQSLHTANFFYNVTPAVQISPENFVRLDKIFFIFFHPGQENHFALFFVPDKT